MLSHVCVGISDFERALEFYGVLAEELGWAQKFADFNQGMAGWVAPGTERPLFVITHPFDGNAPHAGNGAMIAFAARSREAVRLAYAAALELGAQSEGPPGLRPHYHPDYYGAYFRDPDGNKLCVVCHHPVGEPEF